MPGSPLRLSGGLVVPAEELVWRYDTSGGPGGQHANKTASRVEVAWDLAASAAVPQDLRRRLLARLEGRAARGVVSVAAGDTRSQWRNRIIARRRLSALLEEALRPERERIATTIPQSVRRRRLERKRRRGERKRLRKPPDVEE